MKLVAVSVVVAVLVGWLGLVQGACEGEDSICQSRECIKETRDGYNRANPKSASELSVCVGYQLMYKDRDCKACEDMAQDSACHGLNMASWCVDQDCFDIAVAENYRSDFCNGPFVSDECAPCAPYKEDKGQNDINTP